MIFKFNFTFLLVLCTVNIFAQTDTTQQEEDYSQYENAGFADSGTKRYCTSKILDMSPQKLITFGYDYQGAATLDAASFAMAPGRLIFFPGSMLNIRSAQGLRFGANVPVISRNSGIFQLGFNYAETRYDIEDPEKHPMGTWLNNFGLRTVGLQATLFKPLNEKQFILAQAQADLNGDFTWKHPQDFESLKFMNVSYYRYSGTIIYGWKKHDRLMYGFGLSRTYRVGDMNYIPVVLYNYTAPSRKWGVETVFPARLQVKRIFNTRSILSWGHELEGQSYRLNNSGAVNMGYDNLELRRGELRIRFMYERSLYRFIWLSVQSGLRYNWSYDVDQLPNGKEFFRGFFGKQPFIMENELSNTWYTQISINLVSP
jgi:hypothetical protein